MTKKQSWIIFWLLFGLYMFDYMDRMIIVSLFPYLQQDMGLTDAQCGLLMSSVYWSILIFSFPISILVDRWSRTKSISMMAAFWSMATLACAFTKNFSQLLITRTAIGILWGLTSVSVFLMVSHIRFVHFGRVMLKKIPKPVFFIICAAVILTLSFIFKTKNAQMFGYLIMGSVIVYMLVGRKWIPQ